jgi:hypothetical protein
MEQSHLEKLTVTQLFDKLPAFYGTLRFITATGIYPEQDEPSPHPTNQLTNQPTNSMEQSHLEKLTVTQLLDELPAFYGTLRFITVFTTPRHWLLF